jgi:hypothetical protein
VKRQHSRDNVPQWSDLIEPTKFWGEQETEDGLEFQLGGDDESHHGLTVYFSDLLSPMTVLAMTS